jgi:methyltransferase (TIGR00027 family)
MNGSDEPLRNISDTARWVAIYRAMESERPDAIFRDPFARRLGGERGEQIVRSLPKGRAMAWPMVVRTAVMDEIVRRVVERDGARSVLNLAAGLDTRPYRLPLPRSLRWYHVDLPGSIDYVRGRLGQEVPHCVVDFVAADLTDAGAREGVLARVAAGPAPTLAVTEGLLVYLQPEQVAALARALAATRSIRWWLIDLGSPRVLAILRKHWASQMTAANAEFVFAPAEGTAFFEPFGWRETEFRSMWDEANRLKRTPRGAAIWKLIAPFMSSAKREEVRKMSGVVLLERV